MHEDGAMQVAHVNLQYYYRADSRLQVSLNNFTKMNPNILNKASTYFPSLHSQLGCFVQKRAHVRVTPWRVIRTKRESYLDNTKTDYTDRRNINEFLSYKRKKKDWQIVIPKDKDNRFSSYHWNYTFRSDPEEAKKEARSRFQSLSDSLRARGSPRETDPYEPPEDVEERLLSIATSILVGEGAQQSVNRDEILDIDLNKSKNLKFDFVSRCIDEFNRHMPSPFLNEMSTIRDVLEYFATPVRGLNPYSSLLRQESSLPVNLSLISEPIRFDKESDTFFGGHNALPGIISKVPGLRAAKKYPILNQDEFQWPDI